MASRKARENRRIRIHTESSFRFAWRELHALVTGTVRFYIWGVAVSAIAVGVTTAASWVWGA
jgi:hypothetical protein